MMTPHYASPEALLHETQSGQSDVYSLASTAWTLLVGHPPFADPANPSREPYHVGYRVLHEPPPPMPREDVPPWLVSELTPAMSKLPSQRHASALEFAEALRRGALGFTLAPSDLRQQCDSQLSRARLRKDKHDRPDVGWALTQTRRLRAPAKRDVQSPKRPGRGGRYLIITAMAIATLWPAAGR